MKKIVSLVIIITFILGAQQKRPLNVDDLWSMKRIGNVEISPDGKTLAFTVTSYNMNTNKGNTDIYLSDSDGSSVRAFLSSPKNESNPKFINKGKSLAYLKDGQVFSIDIDGKNETKLTDIYSGVSGFIFSPDESKILFSSSVYPECENQDCIKNKDEQKDSSKVKARVITHLMYRVWNHWLDERRDHLFLYDFKNKQLNDITFKLENDVPPLDLGSGNDYNFSNDGNEIAFTMNPEKYVQNSTNNEIYTFQLSSLNNNEPNVFKKISQSLGNDNQPVYSPDGKFIAFRSMKRAGFEADKQNIILYNREKGTIKNLTENFDKSAGELLWTNDSKYIIFTAANEIFNSIFKLNILTGEVTSLLIKHVNSNLKLTYDGKKLFFLQQKSDQPYEIFSINLDGTGLKQITHLNSELLSEIQMNPVETFWSPGAAGDKVQSILVKPPFFDPSKKYPMIFLIHGGPQGHWTDDFHYRWNTQLFASKGYVVVAPNPRGSVGYGQKFTDEISGDWGGKVYTDLMNAYDYAVKNFSFIDSRNTFAAGASYGGYMINWIEAHTNRFNALVSHDGVFNTESMYGTTEELWFVEWEFKGTPWSNRKLYEKWSPHRYIQNAKTPMLIVEGANDFRVAEEQAFQLFTSLQRLGVESKFLYFPDEYHFVTKPQNSRLWWSEVFNWFEIHKK